MSDRFPTADERWPRQGVMSNMGKRLKPNEGNKTFCMAPWTHTYLSPQMERRLCCSSREESTNFKQYIDTIPTDPNAKKDDLKMRTLEQHWNSDYMKDVRKRLMAGEEIPQCEVCNYKLLSVATYRTHFNTLYQSQIDEAFEKTRDDGHTDMKVTSWDYRFNNLCNFKCRMCGDMLSSSWEAETRMHDPEVYEKRHIWGRPDIKAEIEKFHDQHVIKEFSQAIEEKSIKERFAIPRRTKIIDAVLNYDIEETIQKEAVIITVTLQGYIKRGALSNVKQQKRGGKGKTGIKTRDEDSVVQTLSVNTHTSVLFFSTEGLAYKVKAWKIPEGSAASKGKSLFNILPLKNHQSISSIMPFPDSDVDTKDMHIIFATSEGKIRKNNLEDFTSINASGKIAMKLDGNDKIIGVKICRDDQDIILSTKLGKCIRFESKKLRVFKGRSSKGIRGINLAENDTIVSLSIIDHDSNKKAKNKDQKSEIKAKEKFILSITENGYGKRTSHYDYRVTNRGGKGIIGIVNSQRNGNVSSSFPVFEGDQILISTNKGRVIRTAVKEIRIAGRNTQGVRIIKLTGDEKVVSAIKLDDNLI